jgi:hypothetical protein
MSHSKRVRLWVQSHPLTPRPKGKGLLRIDPERRSFTPPLRVGFGAAERVKDRLRTWMTILLPVVRVERTTTDGIGKSFRENSFLLT